MGELVHQGHLGGPGQDGVDVHLLEDGAAVLDAPAEDDLEIAEHRRRLGPAVALDEPDHDVGPAAGPALAFPQHGVGLPHAGGGAEVDPQRPAAHGRLTTAPAGRGPGSARGR